MNSLLASSPLVSIVLPTYNRAAMLDKAITTCLAQTLSDLEIIVVNDGSKDSTTEVVQKQQLTDNRVRLISQQNAGLPAALNAGFRAARGQFLTWTSDDNHYHADALEVMVRALQKDQDIDFVYCDYFSVDSDDNVIERVYLSESNNLRTRNVIGACFMYRRLVYETVGNYDTNLFLAEDYDYWMRVDKRFRIKHLNEAPYNYRLHATSLTNEREFSIFKMTTRARLKNAVGVRNRVFVLAQAASHLRRRYLPLRAIMRRLVQGKTS